MLKHSPEQFESVLQVATRNTEFIDSPGMRRCLEGSDFALADLKTNPYGVSLYLCLPQRFMETHCGWLRMMTSLIVAEMEAVQGKPATGHPVLMLLDEFAGLKRMKIIENAVAQMAGFGVKMFFVVQRWDSSKRYTRKAGRPSWRTRGSNCSSAWKTILRGTTSRSSSAKPRSCGRFIRKATTLPNPRASRTAGLAPGRKHREFDIARAFGFRGNKPFDEPVAIARHEQVPQLHAREFLRLV